MSSQVNHSLACYTTGSGSLRVSASPFEVANTLLNPSRNFAAGSANVLLSLSFTAASVQSIFLVSTSDLTVKTNSTTAPGNTINLKAGRPLRWSASDGYYANPFTADVTAFYITCTAAGTLQGIIGTS